MMAYVVGQLAVAAVFLAMVYVYAPHLALGGVLFGVTAPERFAGTAAGRAIVGRYRVQVLLAGTAALLGIGAAAYAGQVTVAGLTLLAQAALSTGAWVAARARTRPHAVPAAQVRRAALVAGPEGLHPLAEAVPYLLLAAGAVAVALLFDRIPARFPVHWNAAGEADRIVERSAAEVFEPLVRGTLIVLMLLGIRAATLALTPRRAGDARAAALRQFARVGILAVSVLIAAVQAAAALTPLAGGPAPVIAAAAIGGVGVLATLALGTVRLARLPSPGPGDGTPDDRWRAGGLFYVNRDDPAVFVPKRVGLGYTVNLGHPRGVLTLIALVAVPALIVFVTRLLLR